MAVVPGRRVNLSLHEPGLHGAFFVPNVALWDGCCDGRPRVPLAVGFFVWL